MVSLLTDRPHYAAADCDPSKSSNMVQIGPSSPMTNATGHDRTQIDADDGPEQLESSISPRLHLKSWLAGLMRACK